ncbi:heat shock protein 22-like [Hyposmocoma kahamanoa]|uniref:heat shock protein 22-like n=1 Tax=Hyposmocoma kahamanoa TaxID=1477025 RepID=UPI000E6D5BE0|nr:heat shock protein 22-like [Hyposmocoma kahamanoa]
MFNVGSHDVIMSNEDNTLNKSPSRGSSPIDNSKVIKIQRTDMSTFDDSFSFLREKFTAEMKRIEAEMDKLSSELKKMHHESPTLTTTAHPMSMKSHYEDRAWETIASPLIQGDGEERMLNLRFDVSQFDPSEVRVIIEEDTLTVTAYHEEHTDHSNVVRSFRRDFTLPKEVNPDSVISSLSRDGVLTVQAPVNVGDIDAYIMNQNHLTQQQCLHRGGFKNVQNRYS